MACLPPPSLSQGVIGLIFRFITLIDLLEVVIVPILLSIPLGLLGGYHNTKILLSLLGPIGAKNASFLSQFYAKPFCLPTQARD